MASESNSMQSSIMQGHHHHRRLIDESSSSLPTNPMSIQMNHHHDDNHGGAEASKLHRRRRRVKSLLLLAGVSFLAVILLDGVIQLTVLDGRTTVREDAAVMGTSGAAGRQLIVGNGNGADDNDVRMSTLTQKQQQLQPQQLQQQQLQQAVNNFPPANIINIEPQRSRRLHRLPLLPRHALRDRRRRQLYLEQKPLPSHLRDDFDDGMYHASHERRRRRYPVHRDEEAGTLRTNRRRETEQQQNDLEDQTRLYETGSLYQGYGTHYLDLWIGNPVPQRQTLIIDTGSSVTAFPCSRCRRCGTDDKVRFHLDGLYDESSSETFKEKDCRGENRGECSVGVCTDDSNNNNDNSNGEDRPYCKVDVAYAEGSTWTASEASDVVYPWGSFEEEEESGVENIADVGMGDYNDEREFHWKDFRLDFGCQTKVTGLFMTQLEDGIMGMDNRKGSFWVQLRDHYVNSGYVHDENDPFDPATFALCYDRQPLSSHLEAGVGAGSLTLGGTDPMLHGTPMVFADNVTPSGGWYGVHIKGMYLRTNGGSLGDLPNNANEESNYIRVDADESTLNGATEDGFNPIVDSGTTDTYLSASLKESFNEAWKKAMGPDSEYNNDPIHMSPEQIHSLPTVMIVLRGHVSNTQHQADGGTPVGMVGHVNHSSMLQRNPQDRTPNTVSPDDILVAVPPEHYMEEYSKEPGKFTARIYFTERTGDRSILGSNFIMGHEVLFDNTAGRIGFAESHCDYERYMAEKEALLESLIDETFGGEASPASVENQQQADVSISPADQEVPPSNNVPVGLDALATGLVREGDTDNQSDTPNQPGVPAMGEDSLTGSGWSRKTRDIGSRQEIRIPG